MISLTERDTIARGPQEAEGPDADLALVRGCVEGDRARWQELFERYETTIEVAVRHTLQLYGVHPAPEFVEDLQADIAVALVKDDFRRLRSYSGRCRLGAWLKVVAGNHTIDALRKRRPTLSLSDEGPVGHALRKTLTDTAPLPDDAIERLAQVKALADLFEVLPPEDRRFVELFFEQGLSFEAVALEMGATVGAVYARKNRVRKRLMAQVRALGLRGPE